MALMINVVRFYWWSSWPVEAVIKISSVQSTAVQRLTHNASTKNKNTQITLISIWMGAGKRERTGTRGLHMHWR